jgi:hypothetical protein
MARVRLLRREDGIALVMAVGILFVLSITLTSVVYYTSSTSRDASRSHAGQKAYTLAEAALNNGAAQIATRYPSPYLSGASGPTPACSASVLSGGPLAYLGGSASWSSSFCASSTTAGTWTIRATGTVSNPTGPTASPVARTVQGKLDVSFDTTDPPVWQWVYSGSDTSITQSGSFAAPIWVRGNLSLTSTATIVQPATVVVGGNLTLAQTNTSLGTSTAKLSEVHVVGTCQYKNFPVQNPCKPDSTTTPTNTNVWAQTFSNALPDPALPDPTLAVGDWQSRYSISSSSTNSCTWTGTKPGAFESVGSSTLDNSAGTFNLTPSGTTYSCTTSSGSLVWNGSKLTVNGTVFIDGNVQITTPNNAPATYVGIGNIFASGTIAFQNNSALCAKLTADGKSCDTVYGNWDPATAMLIIASYNCPANSTACPTSGNSVTVTSAQFQGGLYGQTGISIGSSSNVQGPLVSATTISDGQTGAARFPPVQKLAPAYPLDPFTIGALYGHTG